jgi:hypothetical protein
MQGDCARHCCELECGDACDGAAAHSLVRGVLFSRGCKGHQRDYDSGN